MPFADAAREGAVRGGPADGLAFDVITRLAKMRSLFVIAPGTVFALDERHIGAEEAGRRLNVDYVAGGTLRRAGGQLQVNVQLTETRSAHIVWADTFSAKLPRRAGRARRDRRPHRGVDRQPDRAGRAQPRGAEGPQLARRLGGAPPRPVAHVPLQSRRQRAGAAVLRDRAAAGSDASRGRMPACRSRTSRTRSSAGASASTRSSRPTAPPRAA